MKFILPDKETLALYDLSETPKYNYILNLKKQNEYLIKLKKIFQHYLLLENSNFNFIKG